MSTTITSIDVEDVHYPRDGKIYHIHTSDGDSHHEILALDYLRLGIITIEYDNGETFVPTENSPNRIYEGDAPCRLALGLETFYNPFDILTLVYFFNLEDSPYTLFVSKTRDTPDKYKRVSRYNRQTHEHLSDDFSSIFVESIEEYASRYATLEYPEEQPHMEDDDDQEPAWFYSDEYDEAADDSDSVNATAN